jgi:hypothetical protein
MNQAGIAISYMNDIPKSEPWNSCLNELFCYETSLSLVL